MTNPFETYAFTAGVLSPSFYGRVDLDKYDLGVAIADNFFVNYRGSLQTRAGTAFVLQVPSKFRIFEFKLTRLQSSILVIVRAGEIRFVQAGAYLVTGDPAAVLTVAAPWTEADLPLLQAKQERNYLILTHPGHKRRQLRLNTTTGVWTLITLKAGVTLEAPENSSDPDDEGDAIPSISGAALTTLLGLTGTPSTTGAAYTVLGLTAIDARGNETVSIRPLLVPDMVNYTATAGSLTLNWNSIPGAVAYRVYRSIVAETATMSLGQQLGFIGEVTGTQFVDNNIIPDFTRRPPQNFDPFARGSVLEIDVTAAGSGYAVRTAAVTVTSSTGTGFFGYPIVEDGKITSVQIVNGGEGYLLADTVAFTGGTGATASLTFISPATGVDPYTYARFQQRGVYAGSFQLPTSGWASRPGNANNFDTSPVPTAADGYSFTLEGNLTDPIQHLLPIRDGLLLFHAQGVARLVASEGKAVSAVSQNVEPQASIGTGDMPPILINNDVVYGTARGTSIYALTYTFYTNSFTPQDMTILSSHFFTTGSKPITMAWEEEPNKLLWVVMSCGRLLCLTYLRDQEIYAWTRHVSLGRFEDVVVAREPERDIAYFAVQRLIEGEAVYYLEAMQERNRAKVEDHWAVDCGLQLPQPTPAANLQLLTYTPETDTAAGTATFSSSASVFTGTLGRVLRAYNGIFVITAVTSSTAVTARVVSSPESCIPFAGGFLPKPEGHWTLTAEVSSVSGLAHLEGQTVSVLADGDAILGLVVEDGAIALPASASKVIVGLPYRCLVKTLPIADPQLATGGKRKRATGLALRLDETRGLALGTRMSRLFEMKDRGYENWGEVTSLRSDNELFLVASDWRRDKEVFIVQDYPLPATVLGYVLQAELSDD